MRVSAITVHGAAGWPGVRLPAITSPLTAVYGATSSGKSTVAGLVGHALFGKAECTLPGTTVPEGELVVEGNGGRYRLRRCRNAQQVARLTVAALDGSLVDHTTTRKLVGSLPPSVLSPLCAVSFRESPNIGQLLSKEFATGFQLVGGDGGPPTTRRTAELAARRDLLAQELETRIASERRASTDLQVRWRELDRLARDEQQHAATLEQRLKAVETSLAETDARLRYRRLELNVELRWRADESHQTEPPLAELDTQIERCRQTLAALSEREAVVRGRLSQIQSGRTGSAAIADQQTWLAVSRQLTADLSGEVSRLARASSSQQCVCHDAHPRLRPIVETIERQLAVLENCLQDQRRTLSTVELQGEADDLLRSQGELRRQLEHLLERRQAHTWGARSTHDDPSGAKAGFSAADAEQLESRRLELEQERFRLAEQLKTAARKLKVLRGERDAIDRQRAALLSARSIEHVQRELAAVQQKLERATGGGLPSDNALVSGDSPTRASDFLAQLTNGDLVRLLLVGQGRQASVVNREGATVAVDTLAAAQRDQVYLSLCMTLLSAASRQGVWLPLVLDEPFERLDSRGTAALVAVLDGFCRLGHQVLIFTRQREAAERLASVGAVVHDIVNLRHWASEAIATVATAPPQPPVARLVHAKKRKIENGNTEMRRRKKKPTAQPLSNDDAQADHSDAA